MTAMTTTSPAGFGDAASVPVPSAPAVPAGWHPDPWNPGQARYWDGSAWSAATQPVPKATAGERMRVPARVLGVRNTIGFTIAGILALLVVLSEVGPVAFLVATAVALTLLPIYVWSGLALDRFHPEPRAHLVWSFVAGATSVFLVAVVLNTLLFEAVDGTAEILVAPVVEESGKAGVLLLLYRRFRHQISGPLDGIVYATMVGLGFGTVEDILYYGRAIAEGDLPATVVVRGVFSPFAHPLFTAFTGIGLGLLAAGRTKRRLAAPAVGLLVAIGLHFAWNGSSEIADGLGFIATFFLVMVPVFIGMIIYARREAAREKRTVVEQLRPEVAAGLLTEADVRTLSDVGDRKRLIKAARALHPQAGAAARELAADVLELANTRDRIAKGAFSPQYGAPEAALAELTDRVARARWALPPAPQVAPYAGIAGGLGLPVRA